MGDARDDVHVSSACECMPGSAQSVKMECQCDLRAMPCACARAVPRPCDRWNAGLTHGCVWQGAGSPGDEHVAMHVARARSGTVWRVRGSRVPGELYGEHVVV